MKTTNEVKGKEETEKEVRDHTRQVETSVWMNQQVSNKTRPCDNDSVDVRVSSTSYLQ